ncbi:MAG: hypothetical protein WD887_01290 [Candidatus Saccharimonadales bacterium]
MAFAENLYEAELPPIRHGDEIDSSFHQDSLVLRRWDFIEDSWRNFLEINDISTNIGARAYSAVNRAEHNQAQLSKLRLDARVQTNEGILPFLLNEAIGYIAHSELLKRYIKENSPKSAIKAQVKDCVVAKRRFSEEVVEYLGLYGPKEKYKGAQDIIDAIQYGSIVVLGPDIGRLHKNVLYRTQREFPYPELELAFRGWEKSLKPPLHPVK